MPDEEFVKRVKEIMDEMSCWHGLENEVMKLFWLFCKCATLKHNGQEWVDINYVREKIWNLIIQHPTLLSGDASHMYITMRIEKEKAEKEICEASHD